MSKYSKKYLLFAQKPVKLFLKLFLIFLKNVLSGYITFSVKRGEIFGFLGANGTGKTTTIRVLCGLLYPTQGVVNISGTNFKTLADEKTIKQKVGYMSQKFTLYDDLTVAENLAFIARLRNIDSATYSKRQQEILDFIAFARPLDSLVKDLPGGIKQQVSLAASLLHDPEIIFLDEPTAGVTPAMRLCFWQLIKSLAQRGKTVFVTTHHVDEAEQCEKISLMRAGKIVAMDTVNNLKKSAFPGNLYDFAPKQEISYSSMQALKKHLEFTYFEPFGSHFHTAFNASNEGATLKTALQTDFYITDITPTLEDVFIKTTEQK